MRADVGARNNLPTRAVPLLDQRPVVPAAVDEVSHRPDVAGTWDPHHTGKRVVARPNVGAGHDAPTGAIPLLSQGLPESRAAVDELPHRPDGAFRDRRHTEEEVRSGDIGAGDNAPTRAVPLLSERLFVPELEFTHLQTRYTAVNLSLISTRSANITRTRSADFGS